MEFRNGYMLPSQLAAFDLQAHGRHISLIPQSTVCTMSVVNDTQPLGTKVLAVEPPLQFNLC